MIYVNRKTGEPCTLIGRETQIINGDRCHLVFVVDTYGNLWTLPSGDFGKWWRKQR